MPSSYMQTDRHKDGQTDGQMNSNNNKIFACCNFAKAPKITLFFMKCKQLSEELAVSHPIR